MEENWVRMKKFININKWKIRFITKVLIIVSALLYLLMYFLPLADKPSVFLLISVHLLFIFCLTLILLMLSLVSGYIYYRRQNNLFEENHLRDFFEKYNFQIELINNNNKWRLTQQIKIGHVERYPISIFKSFDKSHYVTAVIGIDMTPGNEEVQIRDLSGVFKSMNMKIGDRAVIQSIKVSASIDDEIRTMVSVVRKNGLSPQ